MKDEEGKMEVEKEQKAPAERWSRLTEGDRLREGRREEYRRARRHCRKE